VFHIIVVIQVTPDASGSIT